MKSFFSRKILVQLLWVGISFLLTLLLMFLLFGQGFLHGTIGLHLHDTYIILISSRILLALFFLVTFIVFFIKEIRNSFRQPFANGILVVTGTVLIVAITLLITTIPPISSGSWMPYPNERVSSFGPHITREMLQTDAMRLIMILLVLMQTMILLMVLFVVFRWGRVKANRKVALANN